MKERCLLIHTKDRRKFLVAEKHLPAVMEYARVFSAEIYLGYKSENEKTVGLKALSAALCISEIPPEPEFESIKILFPYSRRTRKNILEESVKIRQYIRQQLLEGGTVSLKDLKNKYKECSLTDACLCNHLSITRRLLELEGHGVHKIGAGKYCLSGS